jgi:hypothetical protein
MSNDNEISRAAVKNGGLNTSPKVEERLLNMERIIEVSQR